MERGYLEFVANGILDYATRNYHEIVGLVVNTCHGPINTTTLAAVQAEPSLLPRGPNPVALC